MGFLLIAFPLWLKKLMEDLFVTTSENQLSIIFFLSKNLLFSYTSTQYLLIKTMERG